MAWFSFGALPCRKRNLMTARVSILLKSRVFLTCFRTCFLPGRTKDLSAPRVINRNCRTLDYRHVAPILQNGDSPQTINFTGEAVWLRVIYYINCESSISSIYLGCFWRWSRYLFTYQVGPLVEWFATNNSIYLKVSVNHFLQTGEISTVESSWNVMAHGDAREGKWRGNWRMQWAASTLHTTSERGVSSITTADAHTPAASSRLNWCAQRFKWTRPFRRRTKSWFLRVCHRISNAVYKFLVKFFCLLTNANGEIQWVINSLPIYIFRY